MHPFIRFTGVTLVMLSAVQSASGCRMRMERQLEFIDRADIVVSGEIANYEIVLDPNIRETNEQRLAEPNVPLETREMIETSSYYLSDYARFDVLVQEAIVGAPPTELSVVWNNSTYGEPMSMPSGPYLLALKKRPEIDPVAAAASRQPIMSDPASFEVLQQDCRSAFILNEGSPEAEAARMHLQAKAEDKTLHRAAPD